MKILLLGEFSNLHNTLKKGLLKNGHQVFTANNGDAFKNYPADFSFRATFCKTFLGRIFKFFLQKVFNFNLQLFEHGIRFWLLSNKFKNFDVIQLINQKPIQTQAKFELFLLKKMFKNNKNVFLLCSGIDYYTVSHLLQQKEEFNVMTPYLEDAEKNKIQYEFFFDYLKPEHLKIHHLLEKNIKGIIASDIDYVAPFKDNDLFLGLIPNPINTEKTAKNFYQNCKIVIFLGINTSNAIKKGIIYFEKALKIINQKYHDKIEIIITKNLPYNEYVQNFKKAHILLDQTFAKDQGYNALEAMAQGKVVFTGANNEFLEYYNLQENEVAIYAKPNVDYLVEKLSFLIENPSEITKIGQNAANFVQKEHNYVNIANKYVDVWKANF